ncbi:hypothetical protein GCM10010381_36030 [Streptomyces xantholiticus]|nr:hypothetical protein GCM10010381_36030 [Streptomyces xantholiticus]
MDAHEVNRVRAKLALYVADVFASVPRKDQRAKGDCYLRGLMLEGRRKSIQAMASRLPDGNEQNPQQFVNQSTWDPVPVQRRICERMLPLITPMAWVIDDVSLPKDGRMSVAVAPQYCGALGKRANCQVAVSVHAASDTASCPLQWRLFLPKEWDADTDRRTVTRTPPEITHREKWRLALDMLDTLADWGMRLPAVVADAAYGTNAHLLAGLAERGIDYMLAVRADASAHPFNVHPVAPDRKGPVGCWLQPRYRHRAPSVAALAADLGQEAFTSLTWRQGLRGQLRSRFAAVRVRPAGRRAPDPGCLLGRTGLVGRHPARLLAADRVARRRRGSHRILAVQPAGRHPDHRPGPSGQSPLAHRARLPRTQARPGPGPLRRPVLARLAPPHRPHDCRPCLPHRTTSGPKSTHTGLTLYRTLDALQGILRCGTGICTTCQQPLPSGVCRTSRSRKT